MGMSHKEIVGGRGNGGLRLLSMTGEFLSVKSVRSVLISGKVLNLTGEGESHADFQNVDLLSHTLSSTKALVRGLGRWWSISNIETETNLLISWESMFV